MSELVLFLVALVVFCGGTMVVLACIVFVAALADHARDADPVEPRRSRR